MINSLSFAVSIGVAMVSALINAVVLAPYKRAANKEMAMQENELRRVKEIDDMEMKVKNLEIRSYRYAYYDFAAKIIVGAFFILASFIMCRTEKSFAIPNIVFYTCVTFLIYQYLVPLFSYEQKLSENMINKARINNLVHQNDEMNSKRL